MKLASSAVGFLKDRHPAVSGLSCGLAPRVAAYAGSLASVERAMRHLATICILALVTCRQGARPAAELPSSSNHALRVALLQHSYWSGGFERPLFLLLSDGTALVPQKLDHGFPISYARLSLSPRGADSLLTLLGVDSSLYRLDSLYDYAPGVTDQHSFYLLLPTDSGFTVRSFRAAWKDTVRLRSEVPAPFRRFVTQLHSLDLSQAQPWTPDSVQFQIWPYEYAPDDPPLNWPNDLPDLGSPRWQRRADKLVDEIWTLRLPYHESSRLDSLGKARRSRQALRISDRKWAFGYRWLLPAQDEWWTVASRLEY
jgi:hypothetical protein